MLIIPGCNFVLSTVLLSYNVREIYATLLVQGSHQYPMCDIGQCNFSVLARISAPLDYVSVQKRFTSLYIAVAGPSEDKLHTDTLSQLQGSVITISSMHILPPRRWSMTHTWRSYD